jgi:glycosyltransferase involved in cell wall biosynthesis
MTAAYAYHLDAGSPAVQSGRPHSILRNFQRLGVDVHELFPLVDVGVWRRGLYKIGNRLLSRHYLFDRDESLLRSFADQLHAGLRGTTADFIFSPSTLPLSYLETDLPVTFCADAPFSAMIDYYDSFTRLGRRQIELSQMLEARVLSQAALAVYPTEWAAESAIENYGIARKKVAVIPFGANFGSENRREDVWPHVEKRAGEKTVRLLFVGREWDRKGGDLVVATAAWLRSRGLDVQVDLVGCKVPARHRHLAYLHAHGLLSPRNSGQRLTLTRLYQQAHLLFVPSRAEAYGMVFCEANAFGLPAISTATGGIPGVIRHGSNGFVFPLEAQAETYGETILGIFESRARYIELAEQAFLEFEKRLNWGAFARAFLTRMDAVILPARVPGNAGQSGVPR